MIADIQDALMALATLVVPCALIVWRLARMAMRKELRLAEQRFAPITDQLADLERRCQEGQERIERLQADLEAAREEAGRLEIELMTARRAPAETRDTTPFPAGNGVASPVSASPVFPDAMRQPPLDHWAKTIEEGVRSGNPDAGILAAELHVVAACERAEPDSRLLLGALKEVSRYLARFLASAGRTPADVAGELTAWAQQFNAAAGGRYSIQVPPLGGSVDLGYASPKPGTRTVSAVLTWAVRNAGGVAEFKAEVA